MDLAQLAIRFKEAISQYRTFLVISHQRPDGDAVGSSLAVALALHQLGKAVEVYVAGSVVIHRAVESSFNPAIRQLHSQRETFWDACR